MIPQLIGIGYLTSAISSAVASSLNSNITMCTIPISELVTEGPELLNGNLKKSRWNLLSRRWGELVLMVYCLSGSLMLSRCYFVRKMPFCARPNEAGQARVAPRGLSNYEINQNNYIWFYYLYIISILISLYLYNSYDNTVYINNKYVL